MRHRVPRPRRVLALAALLVQGAVLVQAAAGAPAQAQSSSTSASTSTVAYRGVQVQVPATWPVVDLEHDPAACVRLDRPAVYLGAASGQQACPARVVGRASTLWLRPAAGSSPVAPGEHRRELVVDAAGGRVQVEATWGSSAADVDAALATLTPAPVSSSPTTSSTSTGTAPALAPHALSPAAVPASSTFTGNAFDTCAAPSAATMDAWLAGPYRAVGVYIGGASVACLQPNLTPSWVSHVESTGWGLIPIYVGLQAPCASGMPTIDPTKADAEGSAAATDAVNRAQALGMAAGTPIYDDMESYDTQVTGCSSAVLTFLTAWTRQLHVLGYRSGVYGSTGSLMLDLSAAVTAGTLAYPPDDVWYAHYDDLQTTSDQASYPGFPDRYWSHQQRLHQYMGNKNETWGGVTLNIDQNWLDGHVAGSPVPVSYGASVGPGGNGFVFTGPMTYWHSDAPAGARHLAYWTNTGTTEVNGATWSPTLAPGDYVVRAYLPGTGATAHATYAVSDSTGTWTKVIDQTGIGGWATIGKATATSGQPVSVHVADQDSVSGRKLSVDAVSFTALTTPGPSVSVPGAPTSVTAAPGDGAALVSWAAPSSDGGSAVTGYSVASDCAGSTASAPATASQAVLGGLPNGTACRFQVTAINAAGTGPASAASAAVTPSADRRLVVVPQTRLLDTRSGTPANPVSAAVPAFGSLTVAVAGVTGSPVPAGATAAALNVTVTGPKAAGFLALSPSGTTTSSTINFAGGQTVANAALVALSPQGTLTVVNRSVGSVQVVLDVTGYATAWGAGDYHPVAPVRIADTRTGTASFPRATALAPYESVAVPVAGATGSPVPADATAVAVRATVTATGASGYLVAAPGATSGVSSLNFTAGATVSNLVLTGTGAGGTVLVQNHSARSLQLVLDVLGYVGPEQGGTGFAAAAPVRLVDTRVGTVANPQAVGVLHSHQTLKVAVAGATGSPVPAGAPGAVLNVTVTGATGGGWLAVAASVPNGTSTVNLTPGVTLAELTYADLAPDGTVSIYNGTNGDLQVVLDATAAIGGAA